MSKAVIITRAIEENGNTEENKKLIESSDVLKIAVNTVNVKADIRIFLDCQYWEEYLNYPEQLVTRVNNEIPEEYRGGFNLLKVTNRPFTRNESELFCYPSTLGAAIDLAYKAGISELLLVADNKVKEDGINFLKGYRKQADQIVKLYNLPMNIYQFTKGRFTIPVMNIREFLER